MEGKGYIVANFSKEVNEEDSLVNKVGVHNFRYLVKNPPFYISIKIMDKIFHCFLIDGGSGPSVMSKIIMEELALLLGIQNPYNLGCGHLTVFGDFVLVVNLVRKIYSHRNKLMK
jgi:hypothetical protein